MDLMTSCTESDDDEWRQIPAATTDLSQHASISDAATPALDPDDPSRGGPDR
jgi:hypothetical protein